MTGAMRPQGSRLSGPERRAVAEFVTGKIVGVDVTGAATGRCSASVRTSDTGRASAWAGWSPTITNTRFQSGDGAGLSAADVPRLTLKWALGFPDASVAWSSPTVAGGRLYVGSQNGTVYSLDAKTGCIYWTFSAAGGVRTAIAVGPRVGNSGALIYFGDTAANAYAVNAETGRVVWTRTVDDHPLARITGSPTLHAGRLYVPVASYEESQGADPRYECCTFRGSVSALDAATGPGDLEDDDDPGSAAAARHEHRRRSVVGAIGIGNLVGANGRRGSPTALCRDRQCLQRSRARRRPTRSWRSISIRDRFAGCAR